MSNPVTFWSMKMEKLKLPNWHKSMSTKKRLQADIRRFSQVAYKWANIIKPRH